VDESDDGKLKKEKTRPQKKNHALGGPSGALTKENHKNVKAIQLKNAKERETPLKLS